MIPTAQTTLFPTTLEEFERWGSNDGYNGAALAVRME
jgi:hypothetical protein